MYLPQWAQSYKEPRTEIKCIKGMYYKYEVSYQYNKDKKRTDKITGRLLGKITEADGFVASDKDVIRQKAQQLPKVDIKTFGVYNLFSNLLAEEIASLKATFKEDAAERLLSFAMMRWAYQSPIKRAANYHAHDFCSEYWSKEAISDKQLSEALKFIGQNREALVTWMKLQLQRDVADSNKFVMMDSTHVASLSDQLGINAKGYNPAHDHDKQIRLMYLFSAGLKQPVYYRLVNGNITDIKSMSLCVKEMNVTDVIFIADKGFYSADNINQLTESQLRYIIPVHRNNTIIDLTPLSKANFKKEIKNYFAYQDRIVWYYQYEKDGRKVVTFLNEYLKAKEESDYLLRIGSHPEKYSEETFFKKLQAFGTLTLVYDLAQDITAQQLYEAYKQRNEIEVLFDSYKNFLAADKTFMQDRYVLEGWLMANFIAMMAYYKLFSRLKKANLLSKYAPKDIIELSKSIYQLKINGTWHRSEITVKAKALFKKIGIDYLT
ncbi:MAG: transposase [Taibaiella sp.]|nr:transposase [Taibaiella sp.]